MSLWGIMDISGQAMLAQSTGLGAVSQNVANVNTDGYKSTAVNFSTLLSEVEGPNAFSSAKADLTTLVNQNGPITTTGNNLNLAIDGNGMFIVQGPSADGKTPQQLYTRVGNFTPMTMTVSGTSQSVLTDPGGQALMGVQANANGTFPTAAGVLVPIVAAPPQATAIPTSALLPKASLQVSGLNLIPPPSAAGSQMLAVTPPKPATAVAGDLVFQDANGNPFTVTFAGGENLATMASRINQAAAAQTPPATITASVAGNALNLTNTGAVGYAIVSTTSTPATLKSLGIPSTTNTPLPAQLANSVVFRDDNGNQFTVPVSGNESPATIASAINSAYSAALTAAQTAGSANPPTPITASAVGNSLTLTNAGPAKYTIIAGSSSPASLAFLGLQPTTDTTISPPTVLALNPQAPASAAAGNLVFQDTNGNSFTVTFNGGENLTTIASAITTAAAALTPPVVINASIAGNTLSLANTSSVGYAIAAAPASTAATLSSLGLSSTSNTPLPAQPALTTVPSPPSGQPVAAPQVIVITPPNPATAVAGTVMIKDTNGNSFPVPFAGGEALTDMANAINTAAGALNPPAAITASVVGNSLNLVNADTVGYAFAAAPASTAATLSSLGLSSTSDTPMPAQLAGTVVFQDSNGKRMSVAFNGNEDPAAMAPAINTAAGAQKPPFAINAIAVGGRLVLSTPNPAGYSIDSVDSDPGMLNLMGVQPTSGYLSATPPAPATAVAGNLVLQGSDGRPITVTFAGGETLAAMASAINTAASALYPPATLTATPGTNGTSLLLSSYGQTVYSVDATSSTPATLASLGVPANTNIPGPTQI
ncbi:MAG: flagellar hook basal-body protein, partial [Alphaproteobacteria bacterium]|nr:flagellar hook basal-body protein [Alphaproteobacteria bacterium]